MFAFLTNASPLSTCQKPTLSTVMTPMTLPKILAASTKTVSTGFAPITPSRTEYSRRLVGLYCAAVLLSFIAVSISGYLSYVAFTSSKILACGGGIFNCEHVLTSKWSTLLGLPVAAWASSMYLGVLAALLFSNRSAMSAQPSLLRKWSWGIVTTAAVSAGLAAMWFIGLQAFVLEHYCPWCLGAHSCGILLCISTLCFSPLAGRVKGMCASLGFIGALGLVVMQLMAPEPRTYEEVDYLQTPIDGGVIQEPDTFDAPGNDSDVFLAPDAQSSLKLDDLWIAQRGWTDALKAVMNPTLLLTAQVGDAPAQSQPAAGAGAQPAAAGAQPAAAGTPQPQVRAVLLSVADIKLRPEQWPMLGSPDAQHIFVEMFDYTCKHCRKTQKAIKGARDQMGPNLGVILLPVPLNRNCNPHATGNPNVNACELAELALSVWKADQTNNTNHFPAFHEWLLEGDNPPALATATAKATSIVGAETLASMKSSAQKFINSNVAIYNKMRAGAVPKLIFPTTVMTGEVQDAKALLATIRRQPALPPVNAQAK